MGICSDAEKKDTAEAYKQMYEKLSALGYAWVYNLLRDARGAIETHFLLEEDSANLTDSELCTLLKEAKELGDLADKCNEVVQLRIQAKKARDDITEECTLKLD